MFWNVPECSPPCPTLHVFFFWGGGVSIYYSSLYFPVCVLHSTVILKKASRIGPTGTVSEPPPPDRHYNPLATVSHPTALGDSPLQSDRTSDCFFPQLCLLASRPLSMLRLCATSPALSSSGSGPQPLPSAAGSLSHTPWAHLSTALPLCRPLPPEHFIGIKRR